MKILNLAYPETSDIKFEVSLFPDGQQDIKIISGNFSEPIRIKSRFNSFKDLELILCATNALKNLGIVDIELYIPYLLGARSDRQFTIGGTKYLRDIIAPIINSQNYSSVIVLDPHSDVAEATINNLVKHDNSNLVNKALSILPFNKESYIIISPDSGSSKKIYNIAKSISYKDEIIICSKHRSVDGNLTQTYVPINMTHAHKHFVIIDDICDGGNTFINIAKEIKKLLPLSQIHLIVTHGIFSKGFSELRNYFDSIYSTNSISDINNPIVKQYNVL